MVVDIPDIVTYTNFGDHRLKGFWVAGDSKYVIVFDPLLTGHVIRRMRSGRVRISKANQWQLL